MALLQVPCAPASTPLRSTPLRPYLRPLCGLYSDVGAAPVLTPVLPFSNAGAALLQPSPTPRCSYPSRRLLAPTPPESDSNLRDKEFERCDANEDYLLLQEDDDTTDDESEDTENDDTMNIIRTRIADALVSARGA
uniref:Uncharacterized protein n=1 Tax=Leersia perrieri TaxID=77586 RepID=A0A0D9X7Y9_9ORYZ